MMHSLEATAGSLKQSKKTSSGFWSGCLGNTSRLADVIEKNQWVTVAVATFINHPKWQGD